MAQYDHLHRNSFVNLHNDLQTRFWGAGACYRQLTSYKSDLHTSAALNPLYSRLRERITLLPSPSRLPRRALCTVVVRRRLPGSSRSRDHRKLMRREQNKPINQTEDGILCDTGVSMPLWCRPEQCTESFPSSELFARSIRR